jgi:hypothetical protein
MPQRASQILGGRDRFSPNTGEARTRRHSLLAAREVQVRWASPYRAAFGLVLEQWVAGMAHEFDRPPPMEASAEPVVESQESCKIIRGSSRVTLSQRKIPCIRNRSRARR